MRKLLLMLVLLSAQPLIAQKAPRGIWQLPKMRKGGGCWQNVAIFSFA